MREKLTILILLAIPLLAACGQNGSSANSNQDEGDGQRLPDAVSRGATIYLYERGRVTAAIQADKIINYETVDSAVAHVLDVDVYDSTGAVETHLVSDSGIIREKTGEVYLYGSVDLRTDDSSRLETEYLYWDSENELVRSDQYVRITKDQDVITGIGLETDQRLNRIKILKQVSGEMYDTDEVTE